MRIGIVGDVHWSQYSSIVRSRGERYSKRLENCIQSVNWAERFFADNCCDVVVYLGDFFDKPELNAEEITALEDIKWCNIPHKLLCGNHEMGLHNLEYNSAKLFGLHTDFEVVSKPEAWLYPTSEISVYYLPYILESDREDLSSYITDDSTFKKIIFSHNDIQGIQYGGYLSSTGFTMQEIEDNCELYINGHIHNFGTHGTKIVNLGNLTGQNFSEDATKYPHQIAILDTSNMQLRYEINPYAFNFYKLDSLDNLPTLTNAVVTAKYTEGEEEKVLQLRDCPNVIESRFILESTAVESTAEDKLQALTLSTDHIETFKKYILDSLGDSLIVKEELEVLR